MIFKLRTIQRLLFSTTPCSSSEAAIIELCKQRHFKEAIFAFESLPTQTLLNHSTYCNLFAACAKLKSGRHGRLIHRHLSSSNSAAPDVFLHNHIIIMYGRCGAVNDARQLFDEMPEKNVVSWTAMISGYCQNGREMEALGAYLGMIRSGLAPDQYSFGSVIRSCTSLLAAELGRQVHSHTIQFGYVSDLTALNALVTMYSRTDRINDAYLVFRRIEEKDLVSWGSMIAGFAQRGHELKALKLFREMIGSSGFHRPNEFHFGSVFSSCGNMYLLGFGEQVHGLCTKFGLERDVFAGCSLSDMYARCGELNCTRKAFCQVEAPDLVSWNSLIGAFACRGSIDDAIQFFLEMRQSGLEPPDDITVRCLFSACASPKSLLQGQLIHSYAFKMDFFREIAVCNTALNMYAKCSDLKTAMNLFEEMSNSRNTISWNTMLTACLQHHQPLEVFRLCGLMKSSKNDFDQVTFNSMLSAAADLAYLKVGNQVHCHAFRNGFEDSLMVRNGLINMYAKCGDLSHAGKLFELTGSNCDVFSWNSLIVGHAQFGNGRKSLELFEKMQCSGIKPNHVTFVGVLTTCSHIGLVDEGLYYYDMMSTTYSISPTREHCSCIVGLLSRAGRLSEAESFIHRMSIEPDVVMWKTLLAACRAQSNLDIGRRAAESILRMDAQNSAAHVLLCGIYASSGCWDDLAELRKSMRSRGVKKSPGKSWIEVNGEMSAFIVEDRMHRQREEIYRMLEVIDFDMREVGHDLLTF